MQPFGRETSILVVTLTKVQSSPRGMTGLPLAGETQGTSLPPHLFSIGLRCRKKQVSVSLMSPEYVGNTIQSENSHDTSKDRSHHSLKMSGSSHRLWLWCQLLSSPGITCSLLHSQNVTSGRKPSLSPSPAQGRASPSLSSSLFSPMLH